MRRVLLLNVFSAAVAAMGTSGCVDRTPAPPNSRIPHERMSRQSGEEPAKPLPGDDAQAEGSLPPPPYNDAPLVIQETPEQRAFVDAYNAVGRPRMVVFVNRTLQGDVVPPAGTEDPFSNGERQNSKNNAHPRSNDAVAKEIDYEAIETVLTDWLACGGKTDIVSPVTVRQRLSDEQMKDLRTGQAKAMGDVARVLDADVLIHVTASPTRQNEHAQEVRLVAEAVNLGKDGQSIGRGFVDMVPPLDEARINKFTRFLARVLMDRMTGTWENVTASGQRPGADLAPSGATSRDAGPRREEQLPTTSTNKDVAPAPSSSSISEPATSPSPGPAPDVAPPTTSKDK